MKSVQYKYFKCAQIATNIYQNHDIYFYFICAFSSLLVFSPSITIPPRGRLRNQKFDFLCHPNMHFSPAQLTAFAVVTGGVSPHVRTCTPRFCISRTARPIVNKFGMWVRSHYLSALHKPWVGCIRTCAPLYKCFASCYSATAGAILLKFGVQLGSH